MRTRSFIFVAAFLAVLVVLGGALYAYDNARAREIAPGVKVGGVALGGLSQGSAGYDDLDPEELIALLPSLEPEALAELAEHERTHAARPEVIQAIAGLQGWEART